MSGQAAVIVLLVGWETPGVTDQEALALGHFLVTGRTVVRNALS